MTLQWKSVECPRCLAQPGESCKTKTGRKTYAHAVRHQAGEAKLRAQMIANQIAAPVYPPAYPAMKTVHLPGDKP